MICILRTRSDGSFSLVQCQRLWYTVAEGALFLYMRFLFRRPYPKGERMRSDRYNRTGVLLLALLILVILAACDTAEQLITADALGEKTFKEK